MRTFLNKFPFHRNTIHRALLLSCALTVLADAAGATTTTLTATGSRTSPITGSTSSVTVTGTGTFTLTPTSPDTYTGSTSINAGTLAINSNAIPASSPITLASGTALQASETITLSATNTISLTGDATLDAQSNTFTVTGPISGVNHVLTIAASTGGSVTLSGTNTWTGWAQTQ